MIIRAKVSGFVAIEYQQKESSAIQDILPRLRTRCFNLFPAAMAVKYGL